MQTVLVYLARGVDAGVSAARAFFHAYDEFSAGANHRLVVAAKGWESATDFDELCSLAAMHSAEIVRLPDDGLDWGAYMRILPRCTEEWVCLLNSHSRPAATNWLQKLASAASQPGVGAAGATGSWGGWAFSWRYIDFNLPSLPVLPLRLLHEMVLHIGYAGSSSTFPNPHLRSNAIFLRRSVLAGYFANCRFPSTKKDAHMLESGAGSLSHHLRSVGLKLVVAGADGGIFPPDEWPQSGTFRVPGQANLLVRDNQTDNYDNADRRRRQRLERRAWGMRLTP